MVLSLFMAASKGILLGGSRAGVYNIRPLDMRQSDARDISLAWAAPIQIIIRGT